MSHQTPAQASLVAFGVIALLVTLLLAFVDVSAWWEDSATVTIWRSRLNRRRRARAGVRR